MLSTKDTTAIKSGVENSVDLGVGKLSFTELLALHVTHGQYQRILIPSQRERTLLGYHWLIFP